MGPKSRTQIGVPNTTYVRGSGSHFGVRPKPKIYVITGSSGLAGGSKPQNRSWLALRGLWFQSSRLGDHELGPGDSQICHGCCKRAWSCGHDCRCSTALLDGHREEFSTKVDLQDLS